jgi:hypothetical protein
MLQDLQGSGDTGNPEEEEEGELTMLTTEELLMTYWKFNVSIR